MLSELLYSLLSVQIVQCATELYWQ